MQQKNPAQVNDLPSLGKAYLAALEKDRSALSISNYRSDLLLFYAFLAEKKWKLKQCTSTHLTKYDLWLSRRGAAINTRRRKLLTARSLLRFAAKQGELSQGSSALVFKTPERKERLGYVLPEEQWQKLCGLLQQSTSPLGKRNRLLVHLLAQTGMLVAEACSLRWSQWKGTRILVSGKRARTITVDGKLQLLLKQWRSEHKGAYVFPGHNRHGLQTQRMTPRGVELLFATWSEALGLPSFKPKTLRHFAISQWVKRGVAEGEIRQRLGVTSYYSLDLYKKYVAQG